MARKEGPAVAAAKAAKVARKQRQRDFMRDSNDDGVDISILSENNWGHVPEDDHHDGEKTLSRLGGYKEKMKDLRHVWENAGYYDSHPDHNAANASEELKEMLQSHHRLGPVLKEYKLYVNPSKARTFLLQFPNRDYDQEYRALNGQKPLELRIKPKCGLVELDIPMNIHSNYDQERGIQYGEALRKSRLLQQGGSHGLAGGLGVDTKLQKEDKNAPPLEGPSTEKLLEHFDDANNKGHVMNKITLGGMIVPFKDGDPIYMTATFREDTCTWTKLDAMVQLSPQFSHIDALHEQDKSTSRQEQAFDEKTADKPDEDEAKDVNMAVKSTDKDEEEDDTYGRMKETAKLLKAMRDEPWQRLKWIDQDDDESFEVYDENLAYQDPESAPHLVSELTEEQYLDAISCPRIKPTKEAKYVMGGGESSSENAEDDSSEEELNLEDTEDEEEEDTEKLPPGVIRPEDRQQMVKIEVLCRIICSKPPNQHGAVESHLKKKLQGRADHKFLSPHNQHHRYYVWRLAENRAGRGYAPEDDLPGLAPGVLR